MFNVKASRSLLEPAARTANTACGQQFDQSHHHLRVYLNITAASGTGGLKVFIRGYDKISGNPVVLNAGGTAQVAIGTFAYELMNYPAAAVGGVIETVARELPVDWDILVTVGDASSYTYSVSADVL